ncbi:MAG TPA: histidine phosphatase family protein [Trichococcus sp.]|nr:histidine phosphatase family protein [Trichococcus sp.]
MEKILYLMRHGETEFNVRKKIQGWCDSPLTANGIQQAQIAGTYFSNNQIEIDHAYSSTSERASDTLEIVTDNQMPYQRLKGLKEWNFGAFEGESEHLNPPIPYGDFFEKFGGESEEQMRERLASTLKRIMDTAGHQNVLAVSHGAACRGFMRKWAHNQLVDQKSRLKNCCILKFIYREDAFHLVDIINHVFSQIQ